MVKKCAVFGCDTRDFKGKSDEHVSMHVFPFNIDVRTDWVYNIKKLNKQRSVNTNRFVCGKHFEEKCFAEISFFSHIKLEKDAVPTIFPQKITIESEAGEEHAEEANTQEKNSDEPLDNVTMINNIKKEWSETSDTDATEEDQCVSPMEYNTARKIKNNVHLRTTKQILSDLRLDIIKKNLRIKKLQIATLKNDRQIKYMQQVLAEMKRVSAEQNKKKD